MRCLTARVELTIRQGTPYNLRYNMVTFDCPSHCTHELTATSFARHAMSVVQAFDQLGFQLGQIAHA